ncbi:MAG TPA: ABC transporter permease [Tissierellia bacterium]|jgi:D-methionine transport system permease protein|nr:ABC transporter permease [Tissierellia bacterium]
MDFTRWLLVIGDGMTQTLYMTLVSTVFAYLIGLPLGVLLTVTGPKGIHPMPRLNQVLGIIINSLRSVPFLILLVAILPLTRRLVGTTIGSTATIPPLVIAAAPFIARIVESSLLEVDPGLIEAAESMGASPMQIITKVLLSEARSSLATGAVIATTTILGYSALAGFTGGGGLGAIAVNYGYHRYQTDVMLWTVFLLIVIVQVIQEVGMRLSRRMDARSKK